MSDLFNGQEVRVRITSQKNREAIGALVGLRRALQILEGAKWADKLAGMQLARSLIEASAGNLQAQISQSLLRDIARAGVDLGAYQMHHYDGDDVVCRPWVEDTDGASA